MSSKGLTSFSPSTCSEQLKRSSVTGKNKRSSRPGESCERGSSWAVEVGSHLKVCSMVVENLNNNGKSHFLEMVEAIRSLGLTILKGITEAHGEKTRICFVVEERHVEPLILLKNLESSNIVLQKYSEKRRVCMLGCANGQVWLGAGRVVVAHQSLSLHAPHARKVVRVNIARDHQFLQLSLESSKHSR